MRVRRFWCGGSMALLLAASACNRATEDRGPARVLEGVAVAGCAEVLDGTVCRVGGDRVLRVIAPAGAIVVTAGAARATGRGGEPIAITIPAGATQIDVRAGDGAEVRARTVRIEEERASPGWLREAREALARGAIDEAARGLEARSGEDAGSDARAAAEAASLRARIAVARGEAEAAALFARSASLHARLGEASRAADDEAACAWVLGETMRLDEARGAIERLRAWSSDYPEAAALAAYHEGILAMKVGDVRAALVAHGNAKSGAERLGFARLERMATQSYALVLVAIGRAGEAYASLARLASNAHAATSACDRATLDVNLAWTALLARDAGARDAGARDAGAADVGDPSSLLVRAAATYEGECPRAGRRANALVDLAWARLQEGDEGGARARLSEARTVAPRMDPEVARFALDMDGRLALHAGDARGALRAYDALAAMAAGVSPLDEARAHEGRADALERMGDVAAAIRAATDADARLDEAARAVPLGEGRGAFWNAREGIARKRVALLVREGKAAVALDVARRARLRIAADAQRGDRVSALSPEARARWQEALADYRKAHDAIAGEASGDWGASGARLAKIVNDRRARDVALRAQLDAVSRALFPARERSLEPLARGAETVGIAWQAEGDGWIAFTVKNGVVRAARLAAPNGEGLAPALLASVAPSLAGARRVRFLPLGAAREIDLHALSLEGVPLVATRVVEYVADAEASPEDAARSDVLVVADPTGTLPAARREGDDVAAAFASSRPTRIFASPEATRARVLEALPSAGLLHFAGHGSYSGVDGWDSALPLANGERLTVADILALPRAPGVVVLSGCETGREGARGGADGIGLGAAFLAAGSRAVLASTRPVDDESTAVLMRSLARSLAADASDPASALRDAQLALRAARPDADWSAFRATVR